MQVLYILYIIVPALFIFYFKKKGAGGDNIRKLYILYIIVPAVQLPPLTELSFRDFLLLSIKILSLLLNQDIFMLRS